MTGLGIRVTPEQLQGVSSRLGSGAATIEGTLQQLASEVAPLGSDWAGVAQTRFLELWNQWQRDARGLHEALTGISQLTAQASTHYESAEQGIAASFTVR